ESTFRGSLTYWRCHLRLTRRTKTDLDDPTAEDAVQHDEEVRDGMLELVEKEIADGFALSFKQELPRIALRFDLWRTRLGADPPAKVPPMRIRLKPNAKSYRSKARKYPPNVRRCYWNHD
ncbi:hypothetical protein L917_08333, partial [Phytophthora nicotianae]